MNVLGIETSCDDTSAAVVQGPTKVLASVVSSQDSEHAPYGGVVPEVASRSHVRALPWIITKALGDSDLQWDELDAVAVTRGPGLASSLLPGVVAAEALAYRLGIPLWTLNHLEAHIYSVFLGRDISDIEELSPILFLTVSGGHTNLVLMRGLNDYQLLGKTLDDAAGEALDKAAKLLGLGYPGGPAIESTAKGGDEQYVQFPRGGGSKGPNKGVGGGLDAQMCFSFSGVKTALLYYTKKNPSVLKDSDKLRDIAASYQSAIIGALLDRVAHALAKYQVGAIGCAGGVARNSRLREGMQAIAQDAGLSLLLSPPAYCTDNAAMVAGLGAALHESDADVLHTPEIAPRLKLRNSG